MNGTRGLLSFAIHLHLDYVIATVAKGSLTPFIDGGRGCKCTRTMVPFSSWDIIVGGYDADYRNDRRLINDAWDSLFHIASPETFSPFVEPKKGAQRSMLLLPIESVKKQAARSRGLSRILVWRSLLSLPSLTLIAFE